MKLFRTCVIVSLLFLMTISSAGAEPQPFIGSFRGTWDLSTGIFFHNAQDRYGHDGITARNLQLRADIDLAPYLRWHTVARSNSALDSLSSWNPMFDENYAEALGFWKEKTGTLSASLKVGRVRYLHFPYPDSIALFDTVPSTGDLTGDGRTDYAGSLLTLDYVHKSGLGVHFTGIDWGFGRQGVSSVLESYAFIRHNFGKIHAEARYGGLLTRGQPLGQRATGYNAFIGTKIWGYDVGILSEKLKGQPRYTGVMVSFPLDRVTKALGSVAFDWDRDPDGFAMQVPLVRGQIGGLRKEPPKDAKLVGEIVAERLRTYCSNGQVRNWYEHRLSAWGEVGSPDAVVVMKEEPWHLQTEAVVSPHSFSAGFSEWDEDRTGPAQISQKVTYRFFKQSERRTGQSD